MEDKFKLLDEMSMLKNITTNNISEINKIASFFEMSKSLFEVQINYANNQLDLYNFGNNKSALFDALNNFVENLKNFNSFF